MLFNQQHAKHKPREFLYAPVCRCQGGQVWAMPDRIERRFACSRLVGKMPLAAAFFAESSLFVDQLITRASNGLDRGAAINQPAQLLP